MVRGSKQLVAKFKKVFDKYSPTKTAFGRAISDNISTKTQGATHGHFS